MKDLHKVIKTIRLSEKATLLGEQNNEYVFSVDVDATKIDIKQAVEKLLGKKVTGIDRVKRVVRAGDGSEAPYDRLLLATGSTRFCCRSPA